MSTFNFKRALTAAAVATALSMSVSVHAQETTGTIRGNVTTQSTAAIAGATVTISSPETGFSRSVQVNDDGQFSLRNLSTGLYTVTIVKDGYSTQTIENVRVSAGGAVEVTLPLYTSAERIEVSGARVSMIDTRSSGTALNIGEAEIDRIPVPRSATDVALLAPSTTKGDAAFGNLASFGGSSVAENQTYINGLNVTNFRNGLGFSNVPFEFYSEFQVLTGGYSAEFGRSTGGVINAVTKSGSNEFKAGANVYFTPSGLRENSPTVRRSNGQVLIDNSGDSSSRMDANIYASGALIEDELFYYVMYNPRDIENEAITSEGTGFQNAQTDDAFWGAKVDWQINNDHLIEVLAFSDSSTTDTISYIRDEDTGALSAPGESFGESGGDNWSVKYTGYITPDLSVSALYGKNEYSLTSGSSLFADCTLIQDQRDARPFGLLNIGCADTSIYFGETGSDEREAMRIDFEWALGYDHLLRFGMDREVNTSSSTQAYSGPEGAYYIIADAAENGQLANGATLPAGEDVFVSRRERTVGGDFETIASAFYIEDVWSVTPTVTATIGLRNETFENKNAAGETFAEISNMWAPRIGVAWDIDGDGERKAFVNVGRYFLPVANNTNVRLSGNEFDVFRYFTLEGVTPGEAFGRPNYTLDLGPQVGPDRVNADGSVPDTRAIVDQDIDPMYQDEIILGYEAAINDDWAWGVRGIRRVLNGAIDDMEVSSYLDATYGCHIGNGYVLGNPGEETTIFARTDCTPGAEVDEFITFDLSEIGYPVAERKYSAVELTLAKAWDEVWQLNASYTWSKSYGNTEGLVKSDIGQTDAGITQDFDFPELMDGAYGSLPNDRRHTFKAYGAYALSENFRLGMNFLLQSGRPTNAFGIGHPNGVPPYGDTFYVTNADTGELSLIPRGTFGRTPWVAQLDLNATYDFTVGEFDGFARVDVYNVLNAQSVTAVDEFAEAGTPGNPSDTFLLPLGYQTPRYVQLSVGIEF